MILGHEVWWFYAVMAVPPLFAVVRLASGLLRRGGFTSRPWTDTYGCVTCMATSVCLFEPMQIII